jgi:hypothetical protein
MSELSSWLQANWYGLGNFLVKLAFLAAAIWFARSILKMMRSFQEQVGALLKLNITPTLAAHASTGSSLAEASPYWLTPSEAQASETQAGILSEPVESGPSWLRVAWDRSALAGHRAVSWLNAPMSSGQPGPFRRFLTWLRAPAGS